MHTFGGTALHPVVRSALSISGSHARRLGSIRGTELNKKVGRRVSLSLSLAIMSLTDVFVSLVGSFAHMHIIIFAHLTFEHSIVQATSGAQRRRSHYYLRLWAHTCNISWGTLATYACTMSAVDRQVQARTPLGVGTAKAPAFGGIRT